MDAETLKSYAGSYSMEGFDLKFAIVDGKLTGGRAAQKPSTWEAVDKVTFQNAESPGFRLTFNLENGKVVSLTVNRGGANEMVFKRTANQ